MAGYSASKPVFPWKTPVNQRLSKTWEKARRKLCAFIARIRIASEIGRLTKLLQEKDDEINVLKSNFI